MLGSTNGSTSKEYYKEEELKPFEQEPKFEVGETVHYLYRRREPRQYQDSYQDAQDRAWETVYDENVEIVSVSWWWPPSKCFKYFVNLENGETTVALGHRLNRR